jgi:serine/threonine-protein kinase
MSGPTGRLATALADRYRVERELGQGGMATVYLAHDLRHDRDVAIKVLHPDLGAALGSDRFLSEIRTTARLQHPHILPLLDSGEADGLLYYVMPLVTGETLRTRLERERQLPVEAAVLIAREVADALGYAHGLGVVHRDIKPENILLQGGHALVADFGIALAVQTAAGSRMTQTGLSLGTPQYMSPEQAMGEKAVDARSDLYALGAVTYEMLVGEPPFTGPSVQAIVARLVTEEPRAIGIQRKAVPAGVEAAVMRALEKLPADRFASAEEFVRALAAPGGATVVTPRTPAAAAAARGGRRTAALLGVVALLALAAAAFAWLRPAPAGPANWLPLVLSDSIGVRSSFVELAISPDGRTLLFRDEAQNGTFWLKREGQLDAVPMPGTERGGSPAFSPDGEWVAFLADDQLKKVRLDGGAAMKIADGTGPFTTGITWLDDHTLIYQGRGGDELRRVDAGGGGDTTAWSHPDFRGYGLLYPTPLPDGRGVFFLACTSGCATTAVVVADFRTGRYTQLLDGAVKAWFLPLGYVLYVRRDGTAMAAPFDLDRLAIAGPAVEVLDGIEVQTLGLGQPLLAWSPSGTLAFFRGTGGSAALEMTRITREGIATPVDSAWSGEINSFAPSPDGRRLAVGIAQPGGGLGVWIKQLDRGVFSKLTFGGRDRRPAWSPDGRTIAFVRDSTNGGSVWGRAADGSGEERLLVRLDRPIQEVTWSGDGGWLVARTDNGVAGAGDLVGIRIDGDTTPVPLAATRYTEMHPAVSPDGRWLAYTSDESGANEVYVRPFASAGGGRWQVSNGGGTSPVWGPGGRELFFLSGAGRMTAAELSTAGGFEVVRLVTLFEVAGFFVDPFHQTFSVAPDGRSFLLARRRSSVAQAGALRAVVVQNWFSDLKARVKR